MQRDNVHILVMEDNPRFLDELLECLKEDFNYQQITTAITIAEAKQKLLDPCDVIIADMRMRESGDREQQREDGAFDILNFVKSQNISAIVIVLTANDTVVDCRRAFREGSWDYISKNMKGDLFEALDASIQDALAYLNRWGNRPNQQWFTENREILEEKYWGQWIAIVNQTVIEAADTEAELLKRLDERKLRRFTTTIERIGDLRPIGDLIDLEESSHLEFKSTLQWDIRQNQENKGLQRSCLKTIAAFLNSEGGVLLIGVKDDGSVFGLEKDIQCLKNGSLDKFERHLVQLIESGIGKRFLPYIKTQFANINGQDVCGVYVRKAKRKAFLKSNKGLELYIRTGNSSRTVDVPDIYDHL